METPFAVAQVLLITMAAYALVGCGGADRQQPDSAVPVDSIHPGLARSAGSKMTEMMVLPIEAVLVQSERDREVLQAAVDVLVGRCMAERGLRYIPYPPEPAQSPFDVRLRYGALRVEDAQQHGYIRPPDVALINFYDMVENIDSERMALASAYNSVLYGTEGDFGAGEHDEPTGCYPRAEQQIFGTSGGFANVEGYREIVELQLESNLELYASQVGEDAIASWQDCMSRAGFVVSTWWEARSAFLPVDGIDLFDELPPPSAEERQQAVADALCREATQLERILFEEESRILEEMLEVHSETIRDFQARVDGAIARGIDIADRS